MIVVYASSHGWGHSTRLIPIINELWEYKVDIASTAPEWLFTSSLTIKRKYPLTVRNFKTDVGCVQSDPFTMDLNQTISDYKAIFNNEDTMLENELIYLNKNGPVRLVISDISWFGQVVADALHVPSICIATFDWPFIYQHITPKYPELKEIVEKIEKISENFDYCLVPGSICKPLNISKAQIQFNWLSRKPHFTEEEMKEQLQVAFHCETVLLSFGGHMVHELPKGIWKKYSFLEFFILVAENDVRSPPASNVHFLSNRIWSGHHTDLVNSVDVVMGKLGYGLVSEVLHCKTKFLIVQRIGNPECEVLTPLVKSVVPVKEITPEQFAAGDWDALDDLLSIERIPGRFKDVPTDGEIQIAKWIRNFLGDKEPIRWNIHIIIAVIATLILISAFYILIFNNPFKGNSQKIKKFN